MPNLVLTTVPTSAVSTKDDNPSSLLVSQKSYPINIVHTSLESNAAHQTPLQSPIWRRARFRKNIKTITAALVLFLSGLGFLGGALYEYSSNGSTARATIFLIISLVTGLPGSYMSFYIYKALTGSTGYHFSNIPSFDLWLINVVWVAMNLIFSYPNGIERFRDWRRVSNVKFWS